MTKGRTSLSRAVSLLREEGQALTEYALIITVLSLGLVVSMTFLRNELEQFFTTIVDKF